MRQQSIGFKGRGGALEGIVTLPTGVHGQVPGVVLCHPHPVFDGSMESPIMVQACQALDTLGFATLRFNFRGVGGSEGSFDQGQREQEDLKAALNTLRSWPGVRGKHLGVFGVSFGAAVTLDVVPRARGVGAMALVSPPVNAVARSEVRRFKGATLIIAGDNDRLTPADELEKLALAERTNLEYVIVGGANHTWAGFEEVAVSEVAGFFVRVLRR